jgi:hypothetical protein
LTGVRLAGPCPFGEQGRRRVCDRIVLPVADELTEMLRPGKGTANIENLFRVLRILGILDGVVAAADPNQTARRGTQIDGRKAKIVRAKNYGGAAGLHLHHDVDSRAAAVSAVRGPVDHDRGRASRSRHDRHGRHRGALRRPPDRLGPRPGDRGDRPGPCLLMFHHANKAVPDAAGGTFYDSAAGEIPEEAKICGPCSLISLARIPTNWVNGCRCGMH